MAVLILRGSLNKLFSLLGKYDNYEEWRMECTGYGYSIAKNLFCFIKIIDFYEGDSLYE